MSTGHRLPPDPVTIRWIGARMLEDYDLAAGGYMGCGLFFLLLAPFLAARVRGFGPGT